MMRAAQILLTIAAIQYGVMPLFADLSDTHVFHHDWPAHARFHMVWLLGFGAALASYVAVLVWMPSQDRMRNLRQASVIGFLPLIGFFIAALSMDQYGGSLSAIPDRELRFGVEGNLLSFSVAAILQSIAAFLIWRQK